MAEVPGLPPRTTRRPQRIVLTFSKPPLAKACPDHSAAVNRACVDKEQQRYFAMVQRSSDQSGSSIWPQEAYASYIHSIVEELAAIAHITLARQRKRREQNPSST